MNIISQKIPHAAPSPVTDYDDSALSKLNGHYLHGHQAQYDDPIAKFFRIFNHSTGRAALFGGYIQGYLTNNDSFKQHPNAAVDFGCGAGWLIGRLTTAFDRVYGIDTSEAMLKQAIHVNNGNRKASFHQSAPDFSKGDCDLVTAVHVHYHFDTREKLKKDFFAAAAELLKPNGELLLIGCPSDHIWKTPPHYKNSIAVSDIPDNVRATLSDLHLIAPDGYVSLENISPFALQDGTQMRANFFLGKRTKGKTCEINLTDTFWSDQALEKIAAEAGLELIKRTDLELDGHPHAYMAMHFRKVMHKTL